MDRRTSFRVLLTMVIASAAVGCEVGEAQVAGSDCDFLPADGTSVESLQLVACILDPQPRIGEPIRVFVALANAGRDPVFTRARLDLGAFLLVRVEDQEGRRQDMWVGEPGHFDEETTDIILPRGGIIGRVIDLTCDQGGYRSAEVRCFSELSLREPGLYRVHLSYAVLCGQAGCPDGHPWVGRLSAPPLEFRLTSG
jgi:hypothetical protein